MWLYNDVTQLVGMILMIIGAILPIVNPLGDAPIFLAMTEGCDAVTRKELAKRIGIYSFFLLLGSILIGSLVLRLFGLSIPIVQVAGGAVVCALGWNILSDIAPKSINLAVDPQLVAAVVMARALYPLTMPVSIDAGAIAIAITVGAHHATTIQYAIVQILASTIGAGVIALSILFTYRYAQWIGNKVGPTGMTAALRLSAFITLCIGVSICWDGVKTLFAQIGT